MAWPIEREERLLEVLEADPILEGKIERLFHDFTLMGIDEAITHSLARAHRVRLKRKSTPSQREFPNPTLPEHLNRGTTAASLRVFEGVQPVVHSE